MKEDWLNAKWRPAMGWTYMVTCIMDFLVFPILWNATQLLMKQNPTPWQPLTLQGSGIYHISMGAIVGVSAFGRTKEKLMGAQHAHVIKIGRIVPIQEDGIL